ncbi:MAG TPA: tetratricopeptide repeat protein [Candidatus Aquicultor sp.]|jgi:tetratricopeptide (TPR) repeat protein
MTSDKDTDFRDVLTRDFDTETIDNPQTGEKVSLWLALSIIFLLIVVFGVSALIVQRVYFKPPVIRTAVERDLIRYTDAIKQNPRDAESYVGLAGVYLEIEQPRKAIDALNTAISLKPRSWNAHFEMGMALDANGQTSDAVGHFWQAAAIDPNNELSHYQLGRLYEKQRLYGQAIQAYKDTLRINPTLSDAHYYLGSCYEKTNKRGLAKQEYREALKYVDNYPEAEKALKRLE